MPLIEKVLAVLTLSQKFFSGNRDFSIALYASLALHFLITGVYRDGLRWQLVPIYAAFPLHALGAQWFSISLGLIGLLLDIVFGLPVVKFVSGPHSVGFFHYERKTNSPSSSFPATGTIFYPTQHPHRVQSPYIMLGDKHKFTSKFIQMFKSFSFDSWILSHWAHIKCPMTMGAAALDTSMPVVTFCHGLASSREMSTSLALQLASNGALVVVVEHTDRSCISARFADGATLDYDHMVDPSISSNTTDGDVIQVRRAQTRVRTSNLVDALNLVCDLNDGSLHVSDVMVGAQPNECPDFRGRLKLDNVCVGGHSFGAATVLGFAGSLATTTTTTGASGADPALTALRARINIGAYFTLDPAAYWVQEEARVAVGLGLKIGPENQWSADKGSPMPIVPRTTNMLCIVSEHWTKDNLAYYGTKLFETEESPPGSRYLAIKGAGHVGLCNLPLLLPHRVNVALGFILPHGDSQGVVATVNAVVTNWLRNVNVIDGTGVPLHTIEGTYNHLPKTR